jgi:GNAT superfamily N-acetyltransferase
MENFNNLHKPEKESQREENSKMQENILMRLKTEVINYTGNAGPYDGKEMHVILDNKKIGELDFMQNYPADGTIKISEVMVQPEYRGMEIGLKLYEELISYAKQNNFNKVASGFSVEGGALISWMKLAEKYSVIVNPEAKDINDKVVDFQQVIQMYKDKKLPQNYHLHVSVEASVFEIEIE